MLGNRLVLYNECTLLIGEENRSIPIILYTLEEIVRSLQVKVKGLLKRCFPCLRKTEAEHKLFGYI